MDNDEDPPPSLWPSWRMVVQESQSVDRVLRSDGKDKQETTISERNRRQLGCIIPSSLLVMAENIYSKGTRVWFEDKEHAWVSAEVASVTKADNDTIKLVFIDERGKVSSMRAYPCCPK